MDEQEFHAHRGQPAKRDGGKLTVALDSGFANPVFVGKTSGGFLLGIILIPTTCILVSFERFAHLLHVIALAAQVTGLLRCDIAPAQLVVDNPVHCP